MSTLYIIGLGLGLKGISLEGLEVVKKCKNVYAEFYTSTTDYTEAKLGKVLGVKVKPLDRKQVEDENIVIKSAKKANTAFLVYGDPLTATTHVDITERAKKAGIKVNIIHAASILTAVAETGLQLYKFGRTASIPKPADNYHPISFYSRVVENIKTGAHTLLLLDIGMSFKKGLELLEQADEKELLEGRRLIAAARLGSEKAVIKYGFAKDLKKQSLGNSPHILIVPASLHFQEEEFLEQFEVGK